MIILSLNRIMEGGGRYKRYSVMCKGGKYIRLYICFYCWNRGWWIGGVNCIRVLFRRLWRFVLDSRWWSR